MSREDLYREAIISMLNMIGDQTEPCSQNTCEGCQVEIHEAWHTGLEALGYEPNQKGYREMMRANYPGFPSDEQLDESRKRIKAKYDI